ncbi:hypothetical protein niasHT_008386 [Heterodera trifolii]|uniref:G-protein coupled receptors family 1 profile domain-containing protein n=1 Tax=Heterodera trifolii TaxID=157864 RepID=A0ABD2LW59_9BILA
MKFMAQRLQLIEFNNMTFCGLFCCEYNWPEGHMQLKLAYGLHNDRGTTGADSNAQSRVMYVLILMVLIFMGSWMPLTIVNLLRDMDFLRDATNMYFKLLNVHAIAMTSIVSNPLLYFWMSKRHRRALRDDINWFTNMRRQQQQNVGGLLNKFTPSLSIGLLCRKNLERHLLMNAAAKYNQQRYSKSPTK